MSIKKKVAARKKALKPSAEGNETDDEAEDQNEDEAAEGQDDDQAAEGSDDDDQSAEGQDEDQAAEVSDDEEQAEGSDDEEEAEGSDDEESASSERSRIAAILQSDAAKGRTSLAQHLALNTATSVKDAVAMLKASPKGGNSLSAEMAGNEIPDLGGDAPEGRKSGLAARVKARTKRLSKRS